MHVCLAAAAAARADDARDVRARPTARLHRRDGGTRSRRHGAQVWVRRQRPGRRRSTVSRRRGRERLVRRKSRRARGGRRARARRGIRGRRRGSTRRVSCDRVERARGRGRGGVRAGDGCEVLEDAGGLFAARERGRGDVLSRQVRRGDGGEGRWILRFVEIVVRVESVRDGDGGDDGETFKGDG